MISTDKTALQRIAQTLGVSEEAFLGERDACQNMAVSHRLSEELELLCLFQAIKDPDTRHACLAFVRNAAGLTDRSVAQD